jgi:uncharacterized protein (DUF58 family)
VFGDNEHHEIKPRRSKQSLLQLLNRLAKVNQSLHTEAARGRQPRPGPAPCPRSAAPRQPGHRDLRRTRAQRPGRTAAGLLSRHCDLLLLPVSDPLDHALPAAGLLRFAQAARSWNWIP